MFIATLFTTPKMETTKVPTVDEWVRKLWYMYTMDYYSATTKNGTLPCATNYMDLDVIMLSERSRTEKDNYSMTSLRCRI